MGSFTSVLNHVSSELNASSKEELLDVLCVPLLSVLNWVLLYASIEFIACNIKIKGILFWKPNFIAT